MQGELKPIDASIKRDLGQHEGAVSKFTNAEMMCKKTGESKDGAKSPYQKSCPLGWQHKLYLYPQSAEPRKEKTKAVQVLGWGLPKSQEKLTGKTCKGTNNSQPRG